MLFTGTHEHTIDSKNRLSIPAHFRAILEEHQQAKRLFMVPGEPPDTLWIYPERVYAALAEQLGDDLMPDSALLEFQKRFFSHTVILEPDPQGRVLLPERALRHAGLGREVVVHGHGNRLEIRRRDDWEKKFDAEWRGFPEARLKARLVIERRRRKKEGKESGQTE